MYFHFSNGQYIVAGSDCTYFFIWDKAIGSVVKVLKGDSKVVNCLQPHPDTCLLATSGIDPLVRLWTPQSVKVSYIFFCLYCVTRACTPLSH